MVHKHGLFHQKSQNGELCWFPMVPFARRAESNVKTTHPAGWPGRPFLPTPSMDVKFCLVKIDMHIPMSIFTWAKNGHYFLCQVQPHRHIFGPLSQLIALQTEVFFISLSLFPNPRLNFHLQPAFTVQIFWSNFGFKVEAVGEPKQRH